MAKTGRNSFVATDLTRYGEPPAGLGEAERKAFLDLVTSCPATQFAPLRPALASRLGGDGRAPRAHGDADERRGRAGRKGQAERRLPGPQEGDQDAQRLGFEVASVTASRAQKAPRREVRPVSYYERMALEGMLDDGDDKAGRD